MKKSNCQNILIAIFLSSTFFFKLYSEQKIRVLLDKIEISNKTNIKISCDGKAKVSDPDDDKRKYITDKTTLNFVFDSKNWYLNGKKLIIKNILIQHEKETLLKYDGKNYSGKISIIRDDEYIYIINTLPLEEYVCYVLSGETYESWPLESHKTSAITTRTFAIKKIEEAKKTNAFFDIKSNVEHQTFKGVSSSKNIADAVKLTYGQIITWKDEPIFAMYDMCCGGVLPVHCRGIDFEKFPYLARKKQCKHCKECKFYDWNIIYDKKESCRRLSKFIKKNIVDIIKLEDLKLSKSKALRLVTIKVKIKLKNGKKIRENIQINNRVFRSVFSIKIQQKSSCFYPKLKNGGIHIYGRGRGHLMGLCQWGTKKLADNKWKHKNILQFYYPGTIISKIK
jgi:stage II sporulation protein D